MIGFTIDAACWASSIAACLCWSICIDRQCVLRWPPIAVLRCSGILAYKAYLGVALRFVLRSQLQLQAPFLALPLVSEPSCPSSIWQGSVSTMQACEQAAGEQAAVVSWAQKYSALVLTPAIAPCPMSRLQTVPHAVLLHRQGALNTAQMKSLCCVSIC